MTDVSNGHRPRNITASAYHAGPSSPSPASRSSWSSSTSRSSTSRWTSDARRVRSRLRELGVRRRLVAAEPETYRWAALTSSELTVARLVAEGLTNREVAERLFVSPHTVNSHLRHVFSKLGITSRVELARLARDYEIA
jgi:DNA-binding CsgD family transcriptional regulator